MNSGSGVLTVECIENRFVVDISVRIPVPVLPSEHLAEILGVRPVEVFFWRDLFEVLESEKQI